MNSGTHDERGLVSVLIPAYREQAGIARSLDRICVALQKLDQWDWELVVVDDGSGDGTDAEVERFAQHSPFPVRLVRHLVNQGLGGALRTGFAHTRGAVVITLDSDLSYHEDHIAELLGAWERTHAHVIIASAYMEGGRSTDVPTQLEQRSRIANRVLSTAALDDIKTLTGMVRAYDGPFIRGLSLKAVDVDINVEIIYKTQLLRGTIVEIPGHLDWSGLTERVARGNVLSRRSRWNTAKSLVLTYLFRPFWFPLIPALAFGALAVILAAFGYLGWRELAVSATVLSVVLGVMSLGMLQAKRYFEEVYFQLTRSQEARGSTVSAHPVGVTEIAASISRPEEDRGFSA